MNETDAEKLSGEVEIEEIVMGPKRAGTSEKPRDKEKLVILAIEKRGKGASRITAKVVESSSKEELEAFLENKIEKESEILTKKWPVYENISRDYPNMVCGKSKRGKKTFTLKDRVIMGLRAWIRGTHHHITLVQSYLHEYCYRFNRHIQRTGIFEEMVERMMHHGPAPYKIIIA